ncbi:hypothetical protein AB0B66_33960 [Catellatospora sp. NPDC049111]|uniref:hypothetical protein n=1 Tax=Catellatospora sp. NPDC049111 TaxID=3155271 RepID=UPI0033E724B9
MTSYVAADVYRISATTTSAGWTTALPATVVTAKFGQTVPVRVHAKRAAGAGATAQIRLTATSESDRTKTATATCSIT